MTSNFQADYLSSNRYTDSSRVNSISFPLGIFVYPLFLMGRVADKYSKSKPQLNGRRPRPLGSKMLGALPSKIDQGRIRH